MLDGGACGGRDSAPVKPVLACVLGVHTASMRPIPAGRRDIEEILIQSFFAVVGADVWPNPLPEDQQQAFREEFAHEGMSSGYVHLLTWQSRLLPLSERAARAEMVLP